jgi:cytochrome c-type biogenesis protein CcsB
MNAIANAEFWLLAVATAGYLIAAVGYVKVLAVGAGMRSAWPSNLAAGALLVQVLWFAVRAYRSGHLPIYDAHGFSASFAGAAMLCVLVFERVSQRRDLGAFALPVALLLIGYSWTLPRHVGPLVPVFQSLWLKTHILTAIVAYACFAATFAASCLYLVKSRTSAVAEDPSRMARLDRLGNVTAVIGFPFMTFCIISGGIWADYVWGRYWSWDPKETWSLITWLIFAAYLHARYQRGWRERKAAVLGIVGFVTVLVTFLGVEIIYQHTTA